MFCNYLKQFQTKQGREEIIKLFKVFGTKPENHDPYMNDDLLVLLMAGLFRTRGFALYLQKGKKREISPSF